jgi:hypothetical protein
VAHVSEDGLRVIVTNLLSNAVAYTEEGGHIMVERPAGGVVAVWDSGPVNGLGASVRELHLPMTPMTALRSDGRLRTTGARNHMRDYPRSRS